MKKAKTAKIPKIAKSAKKAAKQKPAKRKLATKKAAGSAVRTVLGAEALVERPVAYSGAQVEADLKAAMGRIKGVNPARILREHTLKFWHFNGIDARGIAPTLITMWANKHLKTVPRLYNYETGNIEMTVGALASYIHGSRRFYPLS